MAINFNFDFPRHNANELQGQYVFYAVYQDNTDENKWHYIEMGVDITERQGDILKDSPIPNLAVSNELTNPSILLTMDYGGEFSLKYKNVYVYDTTGNLERQISSGGADYPANAGSITYAHYFKQISDIASMYVNFENDVAQIKPLLTSINLDSATNYVSNSGSPTINLSGSINPDIVATFNGVDPSEPTYGETSGFGGGVGGTFDNSSDSIDFSSLPVGGASASGLVTMFHPTAGQMSAFGAFLWGGLFNQGFDGLLTSLKKWVNDPIESIIQLSAFPVTPPTGSAKTVKFCGISSDLVGEGVSMNVITSQFMTFDFGSITVPAYWKQALDYTPYSKVSIFLPFCGIQPLNADDIIDATLHLKYNIDLLTGIFSAELKVTKNINGTPLNSVLYNWSGNMAVQIPITASNFSQVFGSLMSAVAGVGIGAISGGLGAAAGGAEATKSAVVGGALTGAGHGLASNIGNVVNSKPHVQHSGRLDGSAGALSSFTPYIIIERPVQSLSSKFQSEQGYPSNVVQTLGDLEGMTVCEAPILDGINCTDDEKTMINNLLCGGVII